MLKDLVNQIKEDIDALNKNACAPDISVEILSLEEAMIAQNKRHHSRNPDPTFEIEKKKRKREFARTGDASVLRNGIDQGITKLDKTLEWKDLPKYQKTERFIEYCDRKYPKLTVSELQFVTSHFNQTEQEVVYVDGNIVEVKEIDSILKS